MNSPKHPPSKLLRLLFKAHPWHGVSIGDRQPEVVTAYIEVVPSDTVKYELDKASGHLRVDRPQVYSNICPTLYGILPQTYCGERVAAYCVERTGRPEIAGDQDPLDICVLSEKLILHGDILLEARPIGGLRMIDGGEADDKLIGVLKDDAVFDGWSDIADCPRSVIERLKHYFLTYKDAPGSEVSRCEVVDVYGRDEAYEVIRRAREDYLTHFADLEHLLDAALRGSDQS